VGGTRTPESALAKKTKKFAGRKSKIDPYAHLVGTVSDKEIAEMSGTSTENVRTWRKRRGIAAPAEDGAAAKSDAAPAKAAKPKAKAKRRSKKTRRRKSKLDPYRKELGVLPDKEIAEKAGTSAENVRAYRKRHGIAAQWRAESAAAPAPAPAPAKAAKAPKAAPKAAPARKSSRKAGPPRAWAFRVTAAVGGAQKEYVTFGADVVEAAQLARQRLGERHADAFVEKIEVLGVAL